MKRFTTLGFATLFMMCALITACSTNERNIASSVEPAVKIQSHHFNQEWEDYKPHNESISTPREMHR